MRYLALKAIVVPSPSTSASTSLRLSPMSAAALTARPISASLPIWILTMLADELAMRLARRTALRSWSRSIVALVV